MNKMGRITSRSTTAALTLLAILALAACAAQPAATATEVLVTNVWARTSPAVVDAGAAYMDIANPGSIDDALTGVEVSGSVAASVELHETVAVGSGMGGGMMEMRPVDRITIPAGGSVSLEPGGYHVMLIDLAQQLTQGSSIQLTLTFERAGEVVVSAEVRDTAQ